MNTPYWTLLLFIAALFTSCMLEPESKNELPFYGSETELKIDAEGNEYFDTVYKQINRFAFYNQDSAIVTEHDVAGKVYVVDFFFTTCPTICPKMKKQMFRIYERFANNPRVVLLSHTIDTKHDSVPVLREFAQQMGISSKTWHLLTGEMDAVYGIADDYLISASEDPTAPGGYIHSGAFVLMDGNHHIRGYYDGVQEADVDQLILDIETLLNAK
jgi:protein SCO1